MTLRCPGAMDGAWQGRRERSYPEDTGATEDAVHASFSAAGRLKAHFERSSLGDYRRQSSGVELAPHTEVRADNEAVLVARHRPVGAGAVATIGTER